MQKLSVYFFLSPLNSNIHSPKNKKAKGKLSDHSAYISAQSDDEINLEDSVEGTGIANEEETNKE